MTDQPREKRGSASASAESHHGVYKRIEPRRENRTHTCHGVPAGRLELSSHQLRKAGKDSDREVSSRRLFTTSLLNDCDQQDEQTKRAWTQDECCERRCLDLACQEEEEESWVSLGLKMAVG